MGSFYRNAQIFRDNDGDGQYDPGQEPRADTDENGNFDPGLLLGKGRVYLQGGIHIVTKQPNPYARQTAPKGAKVLGPLTTVWQSLLDRGKPASQIQATFQTQLQDANTDLDTTSSNARQAQQKGAHAETLTQFVSSLSGACYGACARAPKAMRRSPAGVAEDPAVAAVADALAAQGVADLDQDAALKAIYAQALQGAKLSADDLDTTAQTAGSINRLANRADTRERIERLLELIANAGDLLQDRNFQKLLRDYVQGLAAQLEGSLVPIPPRLSLRPQDDTGTLGDNLTKLATPGLNVEVGAGVASVEVRRDGAAAGNAVPPSDGGNVWTFANPLLTEGTHLFSALARNAQGEASDASPDLTIAVDTTPPTQPSLTSPNPATTATPALSGFWSGQIGDTLRVLIDGKTYTQNEGLILSGNRWALNLAAEPLSEGAHIVVVSSADPAGNVSSVILDYAVQTGSAPKPPPAPTVNPLRTSFANPTVTGNWSPGAGLTLSVAVAGKTYTAANGLKIDGGAWSVALAGLSPGTYEIVATVTDAAGRSSQDQSRGELIVEAPAPNPPPPAPTVTPLKTNSGNPTVAGNWSPGAGLTLSVAVAGKTYTAANGLKIDGGAWSVALAGLSPGTYEIVATVTDAAGRSSQDQSRGELIVEETPPQPTQPTGTLNDTGIVTCGDYANPDEGFSGAYNNVLDCAGQDPQGDPIPPGQDALSGRDALAAAGVLAKKGAGHAGFDYTKLDASGHDLPADAANWSCVRDNVTGLEWEVKTDGGGLHDKDWTYTWYEPDKTKNGGKPGKKNGGRCGKTGRCDTQGFVQAVNTAGWCGNNDWRLPTATEILGSFDYSGNPQQYPSNLQKYPKKSSLSLLDSIDILNRFVNALDDSHYGAFYIWSSCPSAVNPDSAFVVDLGLGIDYISPKIRSYAIRLVRDGQQP